MQGLKIAIGGKGGVGKTTICAVWSRLFAMDGFDVLAIDADPNTNLAMAFGIPSEKMPEPLINMKKLIAERTGTSKDWAGSYFKLNPGVSDLPEKFCLDISDTRHQTQDTSSMSGDVKLLVLGGITEAGSGCACPEGAFLKALLGHTILQRQELVLVDLPAGVEFMGRASVQGIDAMVLVVEPGGRSIETANNIAKMAYELGIRFVAAIANRVTDQTQIDVIKDQLKDIVLLGHLPFSSGLMQADLKRASVFDADELITAQLKNMKDKLIEKLKIKN
jgi:CO dehydrogenase maturation factor